MKKRSSAPGPDLRSRRYLEVRARACGAAGLAVEGYVRSGIAFARQELGPGWAMGRNREGRWILELAGLRIRLFRPVSREEAARLALLAELLAGFWAGDLRPVFRCRRCGRRVHWLELPGDLEARAAGLRAERCAACLGVDGSEGPSAPQTGIDTPTNVG